MIRQTRNYLLSFICVLLTASVSTTSSADQILIYPLYSAQDGNDTYISFRNTSWWVKALKVRFLDARDNSVVSSFNLYLGPEDQWSAVITVGSDGIPRLRTKETSCTLPQLTDGGFRLETPSSGNGSARAVPIGSIQIIEMGVLDDYALDSFGAEFAAIKTPDGIPSHCALLRDAWQEVNGQVVGEWANSTSNMEPPIGGLTGYSVIINVAEGTALAYSPVSLSNVLQDIENTSPNNHEAPSLQSASRPNHSLSGADLVSHELMTRRISNDYVTAPEISASTDWLIYFPTFQHYVHNAESLAPFTTQWNEEGACQTAHLELWNREAEKGVDEDIQLCHALNVLSFGSSSVLKAADSIQQTVNLPDGYTDGWARIDFGGEERELLLEANSTSILRFGLPAIGFAVQKYVNGDVDGVLSNYTGLVKHQYFYEEN
jgi:hypothetical protein